MPRCWVSSLANCSLWLASRAWCTFTMTTRSGACSDPAGEGLRDPPLSELQGEDRPLNAAPGECPAPAAAGASVLPEALGELSKGCC